MGDSADDISGTGARLWTEHVLYDELKVGDASMGIEKDLSLCTRLEGMFGLRVLAGTMSLLYFSSMQSEE